MAEWNPVSQTSFKTLNATLANIDFFLERISTDVPGFFTGTKVSHP